MHHAATQDLYPSRFFTYVASDAAANKTTHIHLGAGLGERKIRRPEPHLYILSIHFPYKKIKRLLQVSERNILINIQSFHLVKKAMASRTHGFISIHTPGIDATDRQNSSFHFPDLHIAGMCPQ